MRRFFGLVIIGLYCLAGCASTATGSSQSAMLIAPGHAAPITQLPRAGTLVVVRYPAMVEADAENAYHQAFRASPIGGRASGINSMDAAQVADGILVKSNYFALSLYKELRERLPEQGVLLSPHVIALDETGALTSIPITEAETLPSVITVDFATYSFPDPERMMGSEPLTFGDLLTPLVVVHTDHRAKAPTHGLILASNPLVAPAGHTARMAALTSVEMLEAGSFESSARELDFITFLRGAGQHMPATQGLAFGGEAHAVQVYPVEKIVLDRFALRQISATPDAKIDPLERVFSASLAERIIGQLHTLDLERAGMVQRAAAVSRFDPSLGALALVGAEDPALVSRLRFAERLLEAERTFLAVQSEKIFEGVHDGKMGYQTRQMLGAEFDILEQRRDLARQQNTATALAVLGAVAAVGVASATGDSVDGMDVLAIDVLSDLTFMAAGHAFMLNSENKALGRNFMQAMVPALEEQITVQVGLLDGNETITAVRFEDFRAQLEARYSESLRAVDTVAGDCAYKHDADGVLGRWQGECANGLAEGAGVGILRRADGTSVEYFGHAEDGRPHGVGYLVEHRQAGARAMEGRFEHGAPDGPVRVSEAGRTDRVVMYDQGAARGPAPLGTEPPRLFDGPPEVMPHQTLALAGEGA
ncbi:MAG: hypothetical protein MRY64_09500 [Hyphomonadaceae bacterium]|nr:hypothetical protein [Hyphomonadaceae bacterium]